MKSFKGKVYVQNTKNQFEEMQQLQQYIRLRWAKI